MIWFVFQDLLDSFFSRYAAYHRRLAQTHTFVAEAVLGNKVVPDRFLDRHPKIVNQWSAKFGRLAIADEWKRNVA